jgi:hypothetical protein
MGTQSGKKWISETFTQFRGTLCTDFARLVKHINRITASFPQTDPSEIVESNEMDVQLLGLPPQRRPKRPHRSSLPGPVVLLGHGAAQLEHSPRLNSLSDWAALVGSLLVVGLAIFQVLLAAGQPLGHAAFGGQFSVLPRRLRIASGLSALLFIVALYFILARAGQFGDVRNAAPIRVGMGVFVGVFFVSTLANAASSSRWEQRRMAPIALVLTTCCVAVALRW